MSDDNQADEQAKQAAWTAAMDKASPPEPHDHCPALGMECVELSRLVQEVELLTADNDYQRIRSCNAEAELREVGQQLEEARSDRDFIAQRLVAKPMAASMAQGRMCTMTERAAVVRTIGAAISAGLTGAEVADLIEAGEHRVAEEECFATDRTDPDVTYLGDEDGPEECT